MPIVPGSRAPSPSALWSRRSSLRPPPRRGAPVAFTRPSAAATTAWRCPTADRQRSATCAARMRHRHARTSRSTQSRAPLIRSTPSPPSPLRVRGHLRGRPPPTTPRSSSGPATPQQLMFRLVPVAGQYRQDLSGCPLQQVHRPGRRRGDRQHRLVQLPCSTASSRVWQCQHLASTPGSSTFPQPARPARPTGSRTTTASTASPPPWNRTITMRRSSGWAACGLRKSRAIFA